ncbi:uncharacterized protein LOC107457667 [Arachis duranensis]|uniref:Uncharacterized protein LOC107457667 n=1 Tax=Arachis duranensis TaxID=130453 RepID=A0A9C6T0A3_ARADU|nr:uncharacterized protein LOC107457667 [Arachis duranensis]
MENQMENQQHPPSLKTIMMEQEQEAKEEQEAKIKMEQEQEAKIMMEQEQAAKIMMEQEQEAKIKMEQEQEQEENQQLNQMENQQKPPSLKTIMMEQEQEAKQEQETKIKMEQEQAAKIMMEQEQEQEAKIMTEQEQEAKNKKNQEQQSGSPVEERTTVGGDGGAATAKAVEIDPRLTSFLEKDESFLTPWSWHSNSNSGSSNQQERERYYQSPPGRSLFATQYEEYFGTRGYYRGPNHQSDSSLLTMLTGRAVNKVTVKEQAMKHEELN